MTEVNVSEELRTVLQRVEGLPEHDVQSIVVLINAGEWKVALEALCTQIYEYDCDLPVHCQVNLREGPCASGSEHADAPRQQGQPEGCPRRRLHARRRYTAAASPTSTALNSPGRVRDNGTSFAPHNNGSRRDKHLPPTAGWWAHLGSANPPGGTHLEVGPAAAGRGRSWSPPHSSG